MPPLSGLNQSPSDGGIVVMLGAVASSYGIASSQPPYNDVMFYFNFKQLQSKRLQHSEKK